MDDDAGKNMSSRKSITRRKLQDYYSSEERNVSEKETPSKLIEILASDYSLNGARARASSGEFVGPRWVVDQEALVCKACAKQFDWVLRSKKSFTYL